VAEASGTAAFAIGGKGVGDPTCQLCRDATEVKDTIDEAVSVATEHATLP
jgi:hypothetical protein